MKTTTTTITTLHNANLGDVIGSLPACKRYYELTGKKIVYVQRVGMLSHYYPGATHPTVDENTGEMVSLNQKMFDMVKPLIEAQEYIERMEVFEGQKIDIDFNVIRGNVNVNLPNGSIQAWLFYAFPDLATDISKPWITLPKKKMPIEKQVKGKIIVNFTERYRNHFLSYFFLSQYEKDLVFAGTEKEYVLFTNTWKLNIPRLEVSDFLEYACAIRACRFLLSNQSFGWNLAAAMCKPSILEVCQFAQNCLPFYYPDSYGYFHQIGAEYYVKMMVEKIK